MSSAALIFDILFSFTITLVFLYRCGNYRRQHPITTGAVFISWSFSILFVFLLPLDISLVNKYLHFNENIYLFVRRQHIVNVQKTMLNQLFQR